MSGDVQPRKRRDKKKKRDGGGGGGIGFGERKSEGELTFSRHGSMQDDESSHGVHVTKMGADDVHLHVQHDHGTGGHWCAKIIFFFLMAILIGLVSLIIMENRDSTDLDTPLSESRFSTYFQGWVDEHRQDDHVHDGDDDDDDDHHHHHDVEENDNDDNHEHDNDNDDDHDDDDYVKNIETEDNDDEMIETTVHHEIEEDDDEENDEDGEIVETENIIINDDDDDDNDDINAEDELTQSKQNDDDNGDEDEDNDEINGENTGDNMDNDNDDIHNAYDDDDNIDDDDNDEDFDEEDDNDDEDVIQIVDNDAGEIELLKEMARQQAAAEAANNKHDERNNDNGDYADNVQDTDYNDDNDVNNVPSWANSLLAKIGIGFALAFVARIVLIKTNTKNTKNTTPTSDDLLMERNETVANVKASLIEKQKSSALLQMTQQSSKATASSAAYSTLMTNDNSDEEEIEIIEEIEYIEEEEDDGDENANVRINKSASSEEENQINADEIYKPETYEEMFAMYRSNETKKSDKVNEETAIISKDNNLNIASSDEDQRQLLQNEEKKELNSILEFSSKSNKKSNDDDNLADDDDDIYDDEDDDDDDDYDDDNAEMDDNSSEALNDDNFSDNNANTDVDNNESGEEEDSEEDEDLDDDISDIDDTELMNRLEAKYGKIKVKSNSASEDDDDDHDNSQIKSKIKPKIQNDEPKTILSDDNEYDTFEKELRRANEELMRESFNQAVQILKNLKEKYPKQNYASQIDLHLARTLDAYAEKQKSNKLLSSAIEAYRQYLQYKPNSMALHEYKEAAKRCLERMTFLGLHHRTISLHKQLIQQFPDDVDFHNQLAITYLLMDRISDAKLLLKNILRKWPEDGLAAVNYGFIMKQYDKNLEQAVTYLERGLASRANGTQDGRFYFHLGDALQRLGYKERAHQVYKEAASLKLFPSIHQRSLYNVANLTAQPFWSKRQTGYEYWFDKLEKNWQIIRAEGLNAFRKFNNVYQNESENLTDKGEWQQFELFNRGQKKIENCQKATVTCKLIDEFPAARNCLRGQVKFSIMQGGTHVWPHCGPTNCRLRAHLGLIIPSKTFVRVAEQKNTWKEGKFLIFDDSFEHEVWHNGSSLRLILIIDVWHPDLTVEQRRSLSPL